MKRKTTDKVKKRKTIDRIIPKTGEYNFVLITYLLIYFNCILIWCPFLFSFCLCLFTGVLSSNATCEVQGCAGKANVTPRWCDVWKRLRAFDREAWELNSRRPFVVVSPQVLRHFNTRRRRKANC